MAHRRLPERGRHQQLEHTRHDEVVDLLGDDRELMTRAFAGAHEVFWHHTLTRALVGPYSLLPPENDPYLDAPHRLFADRWDHTLAVGGASDVDAFVRCQPNPLVALTEGLTAPEITPARSRGARRSGTRRDHVIAQAHHELAAAHQACAELAAWLDKRLAELHPGTP